MSSHNSLQAPSSTLDGIKSRKGIVLDLFDHGPVLMVVEGQLIQPESLSISINVESSSDFYGEPRVTTSHNAITATIETTSDISITNTFEQKRIYLYNTKHKIIFESSYISNVATYSEGRTTIECNATDYSVSTGWNEQFE